MEDLLGVNDIGQDSNAVPNMAFDVNTSANRDRDMHDIKIDDHTKNDLGVDDDDVVDINTIVPQQCREALAAALAAQKGWQRRWHTETNDGARGKLKMGFVGVPV